MGFFFFTVWFGKPFSIDFLKLPGDFHNFPKSSKYDLLIEEEEEAPSHRHSEKKHKEKRHHHHSDDEDSRKSKKHKVASLCCTFHTFPTLSKCFNDEDRVNCGAVSAATFLFLCYDYVLDRKSLWIIKM